MYKRFLALGAAFLVGWVLWDVLRRSASPQTDVATHDDQATPLAFPFEPLPAEIIEQVIETPPHVAQTDMAELAFVAAAVGVDLTPTDHKPSDAIEGYCVRCKAHRSITNLQIETAKNGRPMARGTCPICGAKIVRFLKEDGVPHAE